ncbi:COX15/CtaA family protein [Microbacterium sp. NM3R9]|uniref:COX15/CtaA family protein n=1 Tax=Microbacterium thalli TaxID=3027921 RepID=UPI0023673F5A|nr:COX15/CtaA family protein [Microbacterium thalli]MDN8549902.1 COX15/CtaA family protein [Microbacterium thalli]
MRGAATATGTGVRARAHRLWHRLPTGPTRMLRGLSWASLVANILIIGTGGAVRLTGSGLGCPTWPLCTPESLVSTPEMGIHGVIEFANRTLTGVLGIIAVAVVLAVIRWRRDRPDLFDLGVVVAGGILLQALIGGITVLTGLNPLVVGVHYVISTLLVCACTVFLFRLGPSGGASPPGGQASRLLRPLAVAIAALAGITTVLGVLTTGAGPHSGDAAAGRSGFDATVLQHLHATPSYLLLGLTVLLVAVTVMLRHPARRAAVTLLSIEAGQIAVGLFQARNGLPPLAVGVHMVLAAVLAASVTWMLCTVWAARPTRVVAAR